MRLGPYLLTECIGRGGMAAVYKGKRRGAAGFEKEVVVKTILPQLARNAHFVRLFKEEARLSARLLHNNVVQVHDFGIVDATPFLELEYLPGWNLKQLWDRLASSGTRLPVAISLLLANEVCRGLAYAHSFVDENGALRPIIHRDVSPANIMICRDGSVKLLDFGLACVTEGRPLSIDTFHGKLAYMSPEQLERRQVDRRADVFALGVVLHELLTGRRLFEAATMPETLHRLQYLQVPMPSELNPAVPPALDVVVLRALTRDPDLRYPSATEMLAALDALAGATGSRQELIAQLGQVAPEVFYRLCDGCGEKLPSGVECKSCKTVLDPVQAVESPVMEPTPTELVMPLPPPPRTRSLREQLLGAISKRFTVLRLTLALLWRQLDAWIALRKAERAATMEPRARAAQEAAPGQHPALRFLLAAARARSRYPRTPG
jgi:serine/threonine protein kinase